TAFRPQTPGEPLATVRVGGDSGCHAVVIAEGRALAVCNYGTGEIAVVQLDAMGVPTASIPQQVFTHHGTGPRAERQEGPHAHFSGVAPGGTHLLVADLGSDTLWCHGIGADGLLEPAGVAAHLPPGAGPRH